MGRSIKEKTPGVLITFEALVEVFRSENVEGFGGRSSRLSLIGLSTSQGMMRGSVTAFISSSSLGQAERLRYFRGVWIFGQV